MQIWTLDALRDPFIKHNFLGARHLKTKNPLSNEDFLAAHLAVLQSSNSELQDDADEIQTQRSMYLALLPTYKHFINIHPITLDLRDLNARFSTNSYIYFLVSRRKAEIELEYKAFCKVSSSFKELIAFNKYSKYITARLIVQTRSFRTIPLGEKDASKKELELYKQYLGIDLIEGSSFLVPVADAMECHQREQNVQYKYVTESTKLLLYASKDIQAGAELCTSCGDRADLYAIYGYVNGDFLERTAVLLATHRIVGKRVVVEQTYKDDEEEQLQRYLQYDDEYSKCISELKRLKRKRLRLILNDYPKWSASLWPRDDDPNSTSVPIDDGVNPLISTCRLLALTHRDYEGAAAEILREKIREIEEAQLLAPDDYHGDSYNLVIKKADKNLDFRDGVWLFRLATQKLEKWGTLTSNNDELEKLQTLPPNSKDWLTCYA